MEVSVIIPTYKRPHMLARAIASVLNQTWQDFEILVIDDNDPASSHRHETEEFMQQYANEEKVKYIKRSQNGGGCAARNTGITNAKGNYIAFLDDDDEFKSDNLEKQLNNIKKNNLDVSVCESITIDEKGAVVSQKKYRDFSEYNSVFKYHVVKMLVGTQTFMIRKSWLEKVNGFSEVPTGHEYVLMDKLIMQGATVGVVLEPLVILHVHSEERITGSAKKIAGEKNIFRLKKRHFSKLTFSQRQLVRYRYYSILFETYAKLGRWGPFLYYLILAILVRPLFMLQRLVTRISKGM